jgi:hypothetical protein
VNRAHLPRMAVGAAGGMLLGALYPLIAGLGSFNAVPILTAEYSVVGATLGFVISNYLGFRQRVLQAARRQQRHDP